MGDADVLFSAHRDGVFRYLCRIVGQADAGELTQEVFLRVTRGPIPAADEAGRRAWVFAIARNLALNRVRDDRRHGVVAALPETPTPPTQELATALRQALEQAVADQQDLFAAVQGFPHPQQLDRAAQRSGDAVGGAIDRVRGVDGEGDRVAGDPGVEGGLR